MVMDLLIDAGDQLDADPLADPGHQPLSGLDRRHGALQRLGTGGGL